MSVQLQTNIKIAAPAPIDKRYLSERIVAGSPLPYSGVSEVFTVIPTFERYIGLTVLINTGTTNVEYWFKQNITTLIPKTDGGSSLPIGDYVTGATNIGAFTGNAGIQVLPITHQTDNANYGGNYNSVYNWYYRDDNGFVRIGTPSDGIEKRGYYNTVKDKSWIWNEYLGDGDLGWIFMAGNIENQIGMFGNGITYYNGSTTFPYIQTFWSGTPPTNGSYVTIGTIQGSLTTGSTITIGGGVFHDMSHNNLHFRSIQTKTPNTIAITSDDAFIYLSGKTQTGANVGVGSQVYKGNADTTLQFRSIVGSGDTIVNQSGDNIVIFSSGGTGGGTYDLSSPSVIEVGGIKTNTVLTGKTAFQLFEEMLVPELSATTISNRSASIGNNAPTYNEIGSTISFDLTGTFNRGIISPSYWTTGTYTTASTERVGLPSTYTFSGPTGAGAISSGGALSVPKSVSNHTVGASQSWGLDVAYACGEQPMTSKNNPYSTKCLASIATASPTVVSGLYPYYYGKVTNSGSRPPVTNTLVTGGTKVVAPSMGNFTISNFNAGSNDYTWVAIPATSTSRHSWYIDVTNKGNVAALPTDKYPDECAITITTGTGYWSGQPYKVYMSKTIGTINVPIEFRTTSI